MEQQESEGTGPALHVRVLGGLRVSNGQAVLFDRRWRRGKARALIALLALQPGHTMHREQVMDHLWPEGTPEAAANNLHKTLHYLRTEVAAPTLVQLRDGLVELSPADVDIDRFRAAAATALRADGAQPGLAERAIDLYAGDLLPEYLYEPWAAAARAEVAQLHERLALLAASLDAENGRTDRAEQRLVALLAADASNEAAHRLLMKVYILAGRRDLAMRQYERCKDALRAEMGVEPSPESQRLYAELQRSGDAGASSAAEAPCPAPCPRVRYTTTRDGVRLAFFVSGSGAPLIVMPELPHSHMTQEWAIDAWRHWVERMGRGRALVRYDGRNTGISDRGVDDISLGAQVVDLEAIVDALGVDRFDLFASHHAGVAALAYASAHPERVNRMILWGCYANGRDFVELKQIRASIAMLIEDPEMYARMGANAYTGWRHHDAAGAIAEWIAASTTPDHIIAFADVIAGTDLTPLLKDIVARTLVIGRRDDSLSDWRLTDALASSIPGARRALLPGNEACPFMGDTEAVHAAIDGFLAGAPDRQPWPHAHLTPTSAPPPWRRRRAP